MPVVADRLIIFVKAPVPGKVKTRMCPPLSPQCAADLYKVFVRESLKVCRQVSRAQLEVAYEPRRPYPDLTWLNGFTSTYFLQRGRNLGNRLIHAFNRAFETGAKKVVVIGSDTPHLNPRHIRRAFTLLGNTDAALGPAADGGYYLIGLRKPCPDLFKGISWSRSSVFQETLERLDRNKLDHALLPTYQDMDTYEDLKLLPTFYSSP